MATTTAQNKDIHIIQRDFQFQFHFQSSRCVKVRLHAVRPGFQPFRGMKLARRTAKLPFPFSVGLVFPTKVLYFFPVLSFLFVAKVVFLLQPTSLSLLCQLKRQQCVCVCVCVSVYVCLRVRVCMRARVCVVFLNAQGVFHYFLSHPTPAPPPPSHPHPLHTSLSLFSSYFSNISPISAP